MEISENMARIDKEAIGETKGEIVEYYNLEMILSIGYRVKSQQGIHFRHLQRGLQDGLLL